MRKKYRKATSSTSFLVDSCNASWSSEQKLCWSCEKRAPWDLEDKMDDLKEGRERKQISLRQRALALFHHVLSAPSEIILSRASEKMSHYISPLTTLAGCLLLPIVTFGPGSVLTSVYTLYSPQLKFTVSLKGRRLQKKIGPTGLYFQHQVFANDGESEKQFRSST